MADSRMKQAYDQLGDLAVNNPGGTGKVFGVEVKHILKERGYNEFLASIDGVTRNLYKTAKYLSVTYMPNGTIRCTSFIPFDAQCIYASDHPGKCVHEE